MTPKDVMTQNEVHDLLQRMFAAFTNPATKPEQYAGLLTPDYIQRVDGKQLDYAGFLHHSAALQASLSSSSVSFEHFVTDGVSAATVHIAEALKINGERIRLKVIAYYQFRENRICLVDELTHLLEGTSQDRDLGSRMPD
ncbi:nuclear transport factor 2 family protein [Rhizobium sp. P44RR-XXIV]|uniref:nuclear transport factor 2 family protein n=1 Tax=Rhizobium sp. P44RR-XXIV TaxID=1921145 RepID=UPI000987889B|nr:nuclear transport factor 2 family protein [Rhizobium sp. P44RR-XXIV]TIX87532.1 nuclear transport factor 2 family protein [Rhizobium sp. P44RR-XXIV]